MPPDIFFPEFPQSEGGIEREPEKIFGHPEKAIEGEESELRKNWKGRDADQVGKMKERECEQRQVKMVARERDTSQEQPGQAVWDPPGGQVSRPAGGAFDLDLQQGKKGGANDDAGDEQNEGHGQHGPNF